MQKVNEGSRNSSRKSCFYFFPGESSHQKTKKKKNERVRKKKSKNCCWREIRSHEDECVLKLFSRRLFHTTLWSVSTISELMELPEFPIQEHKVVREHFEEFLADSPSPTKEVFRDLLWFELNLCSHRNNLTNTNCLTHQKRILVPYGGFPGGSACKESACRQKDPLEKLL